MWRKINFASTGLHWFNAGSFKIADRVCLKIIAHKTSFYLQHCGFLKNFTPIDRVFTRGAADLLPPSILLLQQQFP
jgi:hypothetical protein